MRIHVLARYAFFCFFVLCYFVLGTGWFEPAQLVINGRLLKDNAHIVVQWDSGQGFNNYEQRVFLPTSSGNPLLSSRLRLGGINKKNGASLSKDVVCTSIIVDGKPIDLSTVRGNSKYINGKLYFSNGSTASLTVKALYQISVVFETNTQAGVAFIDVNGVEERHDLYMANVEAKQKQFDHWFLLPDKSFTLSMDLPRYAVHDLRIVSEKNGLTSFQLFSVQIVGPEKSVHLYDGKGIFETVHFHDILKGMRKYFDWKQFAQQVIFALLTTWLLSSLVHVYKRIGSVQHCFFAEKRYVFWALLTTSLTAFSAWLIAFWPGVMSVDSLKVWRAAMLPDVYLNDHPLLNVFLYKYLYHIWSNPVIVPFVHIVLMALLLAWFFFWLYRNGLSLIVLFPCFLLCLFSVPVGIYNIMLWKDIPFAILVVFWACMLVKLFCDRREGNLRWTGQRIIVFVLLWLCLALIRHNGLVYLVSLPMLFILLRLAPLKKVFIFLVVFLVISLGALVIFQQKGGFSEDTFITNAITRYVKGVSHKKFADTVGRMSSDYVRVLDVSQTKQAWDKPHYFFRDRYAYWFLLHSGWWDVYPYKKENLQVSIFRRLATSVYKKSYADPWVQLSWNPILLLISLPIFMFLFWWFPCTAILGMVLFSGALPLIYLRIFNWRYYYFLYLGLLFMLPLIALDFKRKNLSIAAK